MIGSDRERGRKRERERERERDARKSVLALWRDDDDDEIKPEIVLFCVEIFVSTAFYGHRMKFERPTCINGWYGQIEREGERERERESRKSVLSLWCDGDDDEIKLEIVLFFVLEYLNVIAQFVLVIFDY